MIYILSCFTFYLDWNFSCCVNGIFYHIKLHASQTFGKNVIILPFLMSYYCMFLIYHVLVFKVNFIVLNFYQISFIDVLWYNKTVLHILKNLVSILNVWGRPYQIYIKQHTCPTSSKNFEILFIDLFHHTVISIACISDFQQKFSYFTLTYCITISCIHRYVKKMHLHIKLSWSLLSDASKIF